MKTKLSNKKGFTIIEVMIVLAIAGLIMLIVFLAVPALQRNSRNTQIKNSAAALLGGVSEFTGNNNGQLPTTVAVVANGTVTISGAAGTTPATARVQGGYTVTLVNNSAPVPGGTGALIIVTNRSCTNNAVSATTTNRATAITYLIESGSGTPQQCQSS